MDRVKHILDGIGSVFSDIFSTKKYDYLEYNGFEEDKKNLASDWYAIGGDMQKVIEKNKIDE